MTLNLLTPSLRTVKRSRSKFVPFLPGLQFSNFQEVNNILAAAKQFHGIECDVPVILAEDETKVKPRVMWEPRRDTLIGFCLKGMWDENCQLSVGPIIGHASDGDSRRTKLMLEDYLSNEGDKWCIGWGGWVFSGLPVPLHLLGSDCCEHFFSLVGGMSCCERNYDFGDLINCASGLNRLAALEFGKENLQLGGKHVKQETIWRKLHPRPVAQCEPDLVSFAMLESDSEVVEALKTGLKEAQGCLIRLNMALHNRVRDQTWWKTPWVKEKELQMFGKSQTNEDTEEELDDIFCEDGSGSLSSDLWDVTTPGGDHVGLSSEDAEDDLPFVGHETQHVMTEVLNEVVSDQTNHFFLNGVKPKARVLGVPVCILDVGSDCAVLFDNDGEVTNTRSRWVLPGRKRGRQNITKEVWFGRVQKIRRKYNGKWGKTRSEIDLLDRSVPQPGERSICQVLFNWYTVIAWSRLKFRYEGTDLQWII
ncbi:hypothetical protein R1sor_006813 [Riccia sorocarpa]|uniref:Uncharacterized protein n=1 Tax=Riccia sorocarpa TaxID=122646 RepID=A0ABD3HS46_9MARC